MMSSKRQANSPAEKVPVTKKSPDPSAVSKPTPRLPMPPKVQVPAAAATSENDALSDGSLFKFEVTGINNKPFYGALAECEIVLIWEKVLGRSKDEIFAMSYNRSLTRNFKVTFKLNQKTTPSEIYPEPHFVYYRKSSPDPENTEEDAIHCKIVGYSSTKPAELGQLTRITAKTNDFMVSPDEIIPWLMKFGSVSSIRRFERNSMGMRTDVFETEIALHKHVPEFLPIAGRKIQISYPGIPKACNNCFVVGHMKRSCKLKKKDWLERVAELRASGEFEDSLFGGWIAILEREKL